MSKKFRWSKVYESSEEELVDLLRSRNKQAERIKADEFAEILRRTSKIGFTLWCAEGSLTVRQGSTTTSLQPGDALSISPQTPYDLLAGIAGYICYTTT